MPGDGMAFVDSNIWLYAFVQGGDAVKSNASLQLVQSVTPVVSTQVINEVCVNLLRKAAFTEDKVLALINSFYEKYQVVQLERSTLCLASDLRQRFSLSYWDGLIVACAQQAGCATLYSEDMNHGLQIDGKLTVVNPFLSPA